MFTEIQDGRVDVAQVDHERTFCACQAAQTHKQVNAFPSLRPVTATAVSVAAQRSYVSGELDVRLRHCVDICS